MKNFLLLILTVAVSFSFSCSSTGSKSSSTKNENVSNTSGTNNEGWTTLDYHYRTGSVSPEYYYHYRIIINKDKSAQFIFYPSYADTGFSQNDFTLTDSQLSRINDAVKNSKVLDGDIPAAGDHPIGGSTSSLTVIVVDPNPDLDQMPKNIVVPEFPETKYVAGLESLYTLIEGVLPAGMMQDAKDMKEGMSK